MKRLERMQNLANAADWHIDAGGVAVCALLTLIGYFAILHPLFTSRDDRAMREAGLVETKEQAKHLLAETRSMRVQLTNAQSLLNRIELPLQPANAINERLAELTALAGECGLEVQYMLPGTISSAQRFAELPLQVSGTGNYRACAEFLHRLREKFPDTGLRAFDLSHAPADPATVSSFSFDLCWFVQSAGGASNPPAGASASIDPRR